MPPPSEQDRQWAPDAAPSTPRQQLFLTIGPRIRARAPAELDAIMAQLRSQTPAAAPTAVDRPATPGEVATIRSFAVEFGSHSLSHPSLPLLEEAAQAHEIEEGATGACVTGAAPTTFAYPYGDYDASSMRAVRNAGFLCAVTAEPGFVGTRTDLFALPRIAVGNWTAERLRDRLRGE